MTQRYRKLIASIGMAGALAAAAVPAAMAKNGADDPVGHNVGDDNGSLVQAPGADDPANHDLGDDRRPATHKRELRHRRHHHRHHAKDTRRGHGKDDPAGHDRGDDHGGNR